MILERGGWMEFDLDVYGVETDLDDALKKLDFIQRNWNEVFPNDISDVDFDRPGEAHFMIEDRKRRISILDDKLKHLHVITSRIYEISRSVEDLISACKVSTMTARAHISTIASADKDIKDAQNRWDTEQKSREDVLKFIEDKGKGKRKAHRR
jgi:hypothetical protein